VKVLTLHQPWASLIALGVKTIETRSWSTQYRGPLAIHAAKRPLGNGALNVGTWTNVTGEPIAKGEQMMSGGWDRLLVCPLGAIVATATLVDVVPIGSTVGSPNGHHVRNLPHDGGLPHQEGGLWLLGPGKPNNGRPIRVEDQRPYGDFTAGRWAWLLADVVPVDPPVPFKGGPVPSVNALADRRTT